MLILFAFNSSWLAPIPDTDLVGSLNYIDTMEQVRKIPDDYRGWVMTNRIEIVGPTLKSK